MHPIVTVEAGFRAPLATLLLYLAIMPATAADLPEEWVDEALKGADEGVHRVIKDHIESQLDWRSYYLDRRDIRRPIAPPSSIRFFEPISLTNQWTGADGPAACPGGAPRLGSEKDDSSDCRRVASPT